MDLQQIIAQAGGLGAVAGPLGISEEQAGSGIAALLPAVLGGFKKSAQASDTGLGGLLGVVESLGGGGLLDNVLGSQETNVGSGNAVLGEIFGSKDVSRAVAADAAGRTGLDSGLLKKLLPVVAMLVAGYMAKQAGGDQAGAGAAGGLGGLLGGLLGGGQSASGGGLGGLLGGLLGGGAQTGQAAAASGGLGGLGALLDFDGDGNPLDDILGMAGKLGGR